MKQNTYNDLQTMMALMLEMMLIQAEDKIAKKERNR